MNHKTKLLNCFITFHTNSMQETKSTTQILYIHGLTAVFTTSDATTWHRTSQMAHTQAAGTDDYTGTRHKCHLGRRSLTGV